MAGKKIRGITIDIGANTTSFTKALNDADKSLNATQRELRDVNKLLKFDPKNTQLLAQKQDLLKKAITDTDNKLTEEKKALEELKKADKTPEVEKQMRALERQIVDDETKMKRFNSELKDTEKASSGLEKTKARFVKFGKGLGAAGKVVGGVAAVGAATAVGIAKAGEAAGKAVAKLASESAQAGDEIDKMSQKLGMSRKGYQEWGFVLSQSGVDINSLQTGMKTMTNQIGKAQSGTKGSIEAFKKLGISTEQLNKMSREEAFGAIVKGMQGMKDSTERAALANQLFGKSGQNLTPLFNETAKGTQDLINKANELGMVMSDDAVDAGVKFRDQLDGLQKTFEATKNGVSSMMLPALTDVMGGLQQLMIGDSGGAKQIESGFNDLVENISKIVGKLETILEPIFSSLMRVLPKIISQFIGLLTTLLIQNLPSVISAIEGVVQAVLNAVAENSAQFSAAITQLIMMVVNLIVKNLPLILQVGVDVILALATGIADALPDLMPQIVNLIIKICDVIIKNLPLIIDAGISVLLGLLDGIIAALPTLIKYIPTLIKSVMAALGKILPKLWNFAKTMFKKVTRPFSGIGAWFGKKFGDVVTKIKDKFGKIGDFFNTIKEKLRTVFSKIGTTIGGAISGAFKRAINGALATVERFLNMVPNAINGVLGLINKLLPKGSKLGKIPTIQLPRVALAEGGVATSATNAIIGEGKHPEAVLPLGDPRTVELFRKALAGAGNGATVNQTINVGQMSSYREAYMIRRATEQGIKKMMRA